MGRREEPRIYHLPITQARRQLGALVRRLHTHKGEYYVLEKDGIPVAALMDPDELDDYLDMQDPEIRQSIALGERQARQGEGRPLAEFLAELKSDQAATARRRRA